MNRLTKQLCDVAVVASLLCAATIVLAQLKRQSVNEALRTPEQGLRDHHIALDLESLKAALRNSDPEIRWLAAEKLGFDNDLDAISSIENALSMESNSRAKINMAFALLSLNDKKGIEALQGVCEDQNVPVYLRLDAARHLFDSQNPGCSDAILEGLKGGPDSDPAIRLQALSFASRIPKSSQRDPLTARIIESNELQDPNPAVRIAASASLVEIGDTASLTRLREALVREADEGTRSALQRSIDSLEKRLLSGMQTVN